MAAPRHSDTRFEALTDNVCQQKRYLDLICRWAELEPFA